MRGQERAAVCDVRQSLCPCSHGEGEATVSPHGFYQVPPEHSQDANQGSVASPGEKNLETADAVAACCCNGLRRASAVAPKALNGPRERQELDYPIDPGSLPPLRNPDILVGENDLTALSYLHEPAVLHNLRIRFAESKLIYTYSGIILVAMNPYKQLPIYGDAIIHAYSGQNMGDMDPHIFAVAEEAYKQMARNNRNQSIIVSGESGAGKTVSARYAMRYFATVSKSNSKAHVEDKVLASNPITEAVGNAKTTCNDNSSRFGKYTEINFDEKNQIIGANMRTYLLEKSRVVFQSENERNYHIFYQLCASAQQSEFKHLKLGSAEEFNYTRMGGNTVIEGVNDQADMVETRKTFTLLGLKEDFQMDVFKILAAILHLGNVQITAVGNERSLVSADDSHLKVFCELLGLERSKVAQWLCNRKIVTTSETVVKPMTRPQAINARDALAKKIYAHLFDFIVERINQALQFSGKQHTFIGVLDIYGFETFDVNSFEQFCINYANEKLQQQFNLHVFKLEQEEYMKEDIPWTLIDFYDNQPVIDLIEAKMGILELLDEECLLPHGTDENWLQKLYNNFVNKNPLFEKPRMSNTSFIIQHFADKVEYKCEGFLEKNRDTVYDMLVETLRASKFRLCANFFQENPIPSSPFGSMITVKSAKQVIKSNSKHFRTTVGSKFRSSLYLLMETLNATTPHYVRCIKPNDEKLPFEFDSKRIVQQLRACGVLETIRISAQSYPSRWTYIEFYSRYGILMTQQELAFSDKKQVCKVVLHRLIQDSNQYQFGKTKIFFRAGQVAYLEKLRLDKLRQGCVVIQKHVRGWLQRRKFLRERQAALTIQQYFRGQQTVRKAITASALKEAWAAMIIQKHCRGYLVRNLYQLIRVATITIQAYTRGFLARRRYRKMLEEHKAVILQKYARAWLARRRFQNIRRFVLNIQLTYRVQRLQKKLEDQNKENHGLVEKLTSLAALRAGDTEKIQKLEIELERAATHRQNYEEKGRRYKDTVEEKLAKLQKHNSELEIQKEQIQLKLQEKTEELKDMRGQIRGLHIPQPAGGGSGGAESPGGLGQSMGEALVSEEEIPGRQRGKVLGYWQGGMPPTLFHMTDIMVLGVHGNVGGEQKGLLEKSFELKTQDYEKQIQSLKEDIKALKDEKSQLHHRLEEERVTSDGLKGEVARLSKQAKTISEFEKEIELLQTQKIDVEKHVQSQKREMRGNKDMSHCAQVQTKLLWVCHCRRDITCDWLSVEDLEHLNEDGELWFAYEGLKKATRVLESHFQSQKDCYEKEIEALNFKVVHLSQEINHLQKLFREENDINESIRHEVARLTSENMDLEEELDMKDRVIKKLQDQVKTLTKTIEKADRLPLSAANDVHLSSGPKEYLGMLEYKQEDEAKLIQNLILDLKPRGVVVNMIPGLPAHILFMCVRYADSLNDANMLKSLMNSTINGIKQVVKDHIEDFEMLSFWLSNTCHFLNCLKQYSGEEEFMKHNSPNQNKNCLNNFDLSEYRQILSDVAIRIYHQFIIVMENNIQPIIVPGMLEYESLQGISGLKPTGFRKRSSSIDDTDAYTMTSILQQLSYFYTTMCQNGLDPELVRQAVKQLFFLIGAVTLNSLFLRKDMCSCRKGMQIRCNISYLEEWLKDKNLQNSLAKETLEPLSQAAWLLQVKKTTDSDAKEIYERCTSLSAVQIIKILNSYTPIDDFEKRVTPSFVRKVQALLNSREDSSQLMLDTKYLFQVTFPFTASPHALEMIQIPSSFKLGFLNRL
ncbi:Unconventional myosin-Vc [Sciurus carolinensis]|uniref:Unconventional myosin-Vc n=1 Tax=Sciurus carolinensis TaxID=30640 RepID=A0AA41MJD8_SCICA|nr:Unconventional myosin-Vc [Sciurus carolinensis]